MLNIARGINKVSLKQYRSILNLEKFGATQSLHTSEIRCDSVQNPASTVIPVTRGRRKKDPPVDWLPFPWERPPKFNIFEESGDKIKSIICDPSHPKPDFELSEELKTANETVKQLFSCATASVPELKEVCRRELIKRVQRHPMDFDSLEVKIAERTVQVRRLFEHKAQFGRKEVHFSRVVLPILIQKRNSMLNKLRKIDHDRFVWLLEELQLYFETPALGLQTLRRTRKNELRRLTKEYHDNLIAEKKAAYSETLKKEQELFLEEKKKILAWIDEEEKAIKALNV